MNIGINELSIENFKGIKNLKIGFSNKTAICGENATGKTTIFDAVTWLLFNKNSLGVEKFDVRPLDADGKAIDFVEIKVIATFVDSESNEVFTLEKVQKQKWTKHTGDENATFTGNVNEYAVNGFPKSEKDYKAFIAEKIDEEHFKLLSSPTYFVNLPWKKQREILMSLITEESDLDFAKRVGGFDILIPELELAPKTSDIMEKWKRTKKELDTKHKELPVRIDEISKQKVDYNLDELVKEKAEIVAKITIANASSHGDSALETAQNELDALKNSLNDMVNKANNSLIEERSKANAELNKVLSDRTIVENAISRLENEISIIDNQVSNYEEEIAKDGEKYFKLDAMKFDESAFTYDSSKEICPVCKRKLPENEIEEAKKRFEEEKNKAKADFETKKAEDMKILADKGRSARKNIADICAKKAELLKTLEEKKAEYNKLLELSSNLTKKLGDMPTTANLAGSPDYDYLVSEIEKAKAKVDSLQTAPVEKVDTTALNVDLQIINGKIASANANANIDKRIEELKAEQRDVSQKIANAEAVLYALDNFIKAKLESISTSINEKFGMVNFKLFNVLLNGGIEETCECTFNGVPYSSLNNGMKICGGLDIINTLSKEFNKSVFVFVDNAESVNDYKLPETSGQLITLSVTDDKELKVNKEA